MAYNAFYPDKVELINFGLDKLYKYAYMGKLDWSDPVNPLYKKVWNKLYFETKNTTLFDNTSIFNNERNLFSFSATIGVHYREQYGQTKINFPSILKNELENLFPFSVTLEKRMVPCNILRITTENLKKIKSIHSNKKVELDGGKYQGFKAEKINFTNLINILVMGGTDYNLDIPFFYEGKEEEIDIVIKSVYWKDRVKELEQRGFEIHQEDREMDVIVVRDKF